MGDGVSTEQRRRKERAATEDSNSTDWKYREAVMEMGVMELEMQKRLSQEGRILREGVHNDLERPHWKCERGCGRGWV